jgi:hypothetical protein
MGEASPVARHHTHHQSEIGGHNSIQSPFAPAGHSSWGILVILPFSNKPTEMEFFFTGEQGHPADGVEIVPQCVGHRDS